MFIYGSKGTEDLVCNKKETLSKAIKVKKQEKLSPKIIPIQKLQEPAECHILDSETAECQILDLENHQNPELPDLYLVPYTITLVAQT